MSKIALGGAPTGTATFDIVAPATNTNRTIMLPDTSGQVSVLDLRTAVTASGTSVDFLNIPATARRITVMFSGVSTNGSSGIIIQAGSGGLQTSGYNGVGSTYASGTPTTVEVSAGFPVVASVLATRTYSGMSHINNLTGNLWVESSTVADNAGLTMAHGGGAVTLSGTLDRLRITTKYGTDTFDAGSISILVE